VGLVLKLNHSLANGLAAVRIAGGLLDVSSEARSPAPPPVAAAAGPSRWALLVDNLRGQHRAGSGAGAAAPSLEAVAQARALAGAPRRATAITRRSAVRPRWSLH
jgi:hypothetical protein